MYYFRFIVLLLFTTFYAVAETSIRLSGNISKSENQIFELLGGRLEHIKIKETAPFRADDAAFILRQLLRNDGYLSAEVDWKIISRSEILLNVSEGKRQSLGEVKIEGVAKEKAKLLEKLYEKPALKNHQFGAGAPPFRKADIAIGLLNITQQLRAEGYWAAEVTLEEQMTNSETGSVNVSILVQPGPLHRIGTPQLYGENSQALNQAKEAIAPFIKLEATTANLNSMRNAVDQLFQSSGYPDAKISMTNRLAAGEFIPEFTIDLGKRVELRKLVIKGLKTTNPKRIMTRMKKLEGDWYDEAAMDQRVRQLLATGAFSSVLVDTKSVSDTEIDATLRIRERPARSFSIAGGIDSYQGFLLRTTYADRNLWGQLLGFSTGFELSGRGLLGETEFTDPWLFGSDIFATLRAYALIYSREGYDSFETGIDANFAREIGDHYKIEMLASYSFTNLTASGLPDSALGETSYVNPHLRINQTFDFRDSPILPTKGWYIESPLEIGAAVGDSSTSYISSSITGGWYHQFDSNYQISLGGHIGWLFPSGDGDSLPIDLRLFNGGSHSVRSFPERELGPTADGFPTGGEATWNANTELIRTIAGSIKGVVFIDAGSLSRSVSTISSSEIEVAVGLGVRLDLPIGPVRFEYGYNATQDPGEPVGTFQFAIGASF